MQILPPIITPPPFQVNMPANSSETAEALLRRVHRVAELESRQGETCSDQGEEHPWRRGKRRKVAER
jgi:hypothetical protein